MPLRCHTNDFPLRLRTQKRAVETVAVFIAAEEEGVIINDPDRCLINERGGGEPQEAEDKQDPPQPQYQSTVTILIFSTMRHLVGLRFSKRHRGLLQTLRFRILWDPHHHCHRHPIMLLMPYK